MVAVGFNPRTRSGVQTSRRVATPDGFQSSLRDEIGRVKCRGPWVVTHGYRHSVATRRLAVYYPRDKTRPSYQQQIPAHQADFAQASVGITYIISRGLQKVSV